MSEEREKSFVCTMERPFVFVHITDIHINRDNYEGSYNDFRHFMKDVLPEISPSVVVNTGDITCSSLIDKQSKCFLPFLSVGVFRLDEWQLYMTSCRFLTSVDMRPC